MARAEKCAEKLVPHCLGDRVPAPGGGWCLTLWAFNEPIKLFQSWKKENNKQKQKRLLCSHKKERQSSLCPDMEGSPSEKKQGTETIQMFNPFIKRGEERDCICSCVCITRLCRAHRAPVPLAACRGWGGGPGGLYSSFLSLLNLNQETELPTPKVKLKQKTKNPMGSKI